MLLGENEKAIEMADQNVVLAPEEANSYDTRGDIYAFQGDLEKAIENYQRAIDIEYYFDNSTGKLASMYIYKREYEQAENIIRKFLSEPDDRFRSGARTGMALIPMYQGRFNETLAQLDEGLAWDKKNDIDEANKVGKHSIKFFIYLERGQFDLAWREARIMNEYMAILSPEDPFSTRTADIILYAREGKTGKADSLLQLIRNDIDPQEPNLVSGYHRMVGVVELIKGNTQSAIVHLQKGLYENSVPLFETRYFLGHAYLNLDQPARAVEVLEPALKRCDEHMMQFPIWNVKARYYLGRAYDQLGQREQAIARYEEFLGIWKDADEGIEEIENARERVEVLKARS